MTRSMRLGVLVLGIAISFVSVAHEPPSGLLMHLPMDGDLSDSSGHGNAAEFIQAGGTAAAGKLQFVEGKYGGSVLFGDGTTAIRIPIDLHPEIYQQVTVTLWAYAEYENSGGYLVANGGYAGPILQYAGPEIQAHSVRSITRQRAVFRPGRWMFIAGVWDHTEGTMRLHIGRRVAEGSYNPEAAMAANTAKADIWLGAYDDRLGRPVQGLRLDEVRIYSRALSTEEVEGLALGPIGTQIVGENADSGQFNSQTLIQNAPTAGDVEANIDSQLEAASADPLRAGEAELERSRDAAMTEALIEGSPAPGNVEENITDQLAAGSYETRQQALEPDDRISGAGQIGVAGSLEVQTTEGDEVYVRIDESSNPVSTVDVSSYGDYHRIALIDFVDSAIHTIQWLEKNDQPCDIQVSAYTSGLNRFGAPNSKTDRLEFCRGDGGNELSRLIVSLQGFPAAVNALNVCEIGDPPSGLPLLPPLADSVPVKGVRIDGRRISAQRTLGAETVSDSEERPRCVDWRSHVSRCPDDYVATGVQLVFLRQQRNDRLVNIGLICRGVLP